MKTRIKIGYIPRLIIICLLMVAFLNGIPAGCSMKAKSGDEPNAAAGAKAASDSSEATEATYEPVQEKILASIRDNYSDWGIDIQSIDLVIGLNNSARITLDFPDHSVSQKVVAGLCILKENFPRLKKYSISVGGTDYSADSKQLDYILGQGYTYESPEEETDSYLDVIKVGIPDTDNETEISSE